MILEDHGCDSYQARWFERTLIPLFVDVAMDEGMRRPLTCLSPINISLELNLADF